jgi:polyisoprenoid-binding protein YceI
MKEFLLLFFFASNCFALPVTWLANKDHSQIRFDVTYLSLSKVNGGFRNFSAKAILVDDTPKEIQVIIDSSSISTENNIRDGHLQGKDFLDAKKFPFIIFKSTEIKKISGQTYQATGDLTVKDIQKKKSFQFTLSDPKKDTWNYENRFVNFNFNFLRSEFDLTWNKAIEKGKFLVSDEIAVNGSIQLQPKGRSTPKSKHMIPVTRVTELKEKVIRGEMSIEGFNEEKKRIENNDKITLEIEQDSPEVKSLNKEKKQVFNSNEIKHRDTLGFTVALTILGILGMIASLIISFTIKDFFIKIAPSTYEEVNYLGTISDLFTYIFIGSYILAIWYLGWG